MDVTKVQKPFKERLRRVTRRHRRKLVYVWHNTIRCIPIEASGFKELKQKICFRFRFNENDDLEIRDHKIGFDVQEWKYIKTKGTLCVINKSSREEWDERHDERWNGPIKQKEQNINYIKIEGAHGITQIGYENSIVVGNAAEMP